MGPKTQELITTLESLILILEEDNKDHWVDWLQTARKWLVQSDFSGIEKLLSAYGGMGSFNDLYLSKITRKNENFSDLQSKAWQLATEIKQEYELTK